MDMGGSPGEMDSFLNTMVGQSLMLEIDDGYLSLAITPQRKNLTPEKINRLMNEIYPRRQSPNMVTA
jgi:hypothetical protein